MHTRSTVSIESPSTFPTTGIKFEIATLAVFAVNPSTLLLKVPSSDNNPTNIVSIIPKPPYYARFKKARYFIYLYFARYVGYYAKHC